MAFPNAKQIERARRRLDRVPGTRMLAPDPTPLEKLRWVLCPRFVRYKIEHPMTVDEMAGLLGLDKARASKILHHRIAGFSTDRLIRLYQLLNPRLKVRVS
jgi:hypothetical protein